MLCLFRIKLIMAFRDSFSGNCHEFLGKIVEWFSIAFSTFELRVVFKLAAAQS